MQDSHHSKLQGILQNINDSTTILFHQLLALKNIVQPQEFATFSRTINVILLNIIEPSSKYSAVLIESNLSTQVMISS